ncbi:RagB/SusD family nutrient uptake outer membrane protein [Flammeovirga sp. EKP202]|uniref:RagB/SusD family nutrient uptake outer membrane protein n=1 Tax=Flammeovirga sp. EKP202 TaxID=2770592 RepID=UPI00165FCFC1|nr:RagB/SusD family nutrient uptake outer membrane protein [Flammeovirga sp. EKP202]MBD0402369.1 RagB/SusD family nutrient uptake outer membrane protein [Flammeovirga sp. EKP202]
MTSIKKYSLLLLSFLLLLGCQINNIETTINDDNSNRKTLDLKDIEIAAPYTTIEQHEDAFYILYHLLSNDYYNGNILSIDLIADILAGDIYKGGANASDIADFFEFQKHTINVYNSTLKAIWEKKYDGIRVANALLSNFNDELFPENLQQEKEYYKAEARALRAHFYFELARFFERPPIIPAGKFEGYNYTQPTEVELYSFIASELFEVSDQMRKHQDDFGRLGKYSVLAELVKVYVFYTGVYKDESLTLKDGIILNRNKVINIIEEIIQQSGTSLSPNFEELFQSSLGKNNFNQEVIFEIVHDKKPHLNWSGYEIGNLKSQMTGPVGYFNSESSINWGWGFGIPTRKLYDSFDENDKRLNSTIITAKKLIDDLKGDESYPLSYSFNHTGLYNYKYTTHKKSDGSGGYIESLELHYDQNYHYIRLADIYLIGAELYLAEGNQAKATEYVNIIRQRAGLYSKSTVTFDDIVEERYHELAIEGHRYFDLMRWGSNFLNEITVSSYTLYESKHHDSKYFLYGKNLTGDIGVEADFETTFYAPSRGFLPIPQDIIDQSNNLVQNQGY